MIKLIHWPTKSRTITSPFGPRWGRFHDGIDIAPITRHIDGDKLFAVADGTVVASKTNNGGDKVGLGHYMVIQHDGFFTEYAHMQELGLPVGTKVKAGQVVGLMGHSGECFSSTPGGTGTHLHFRIGEGTYNAAVSHKKDGNGKTFGSVNPEPFLSAIAKEEPWKQAIRATHDLPEEWIDYYQDLIDKGGLGQFIAKSLMKLYNH
jgi:murein DD-endopeptidase MepM/ murein hydrolase activator NlpD